jgi:ankyrin repeat protein
VLRKWTSWYGIPFKIDDFELISIEVLRSLLPYLSSSVLTAVNENGSPPLHWAIMNNHVSIVQLLIEVPEEKGGGVPLLKVSNYI